MAYRCKENQSKECDGCGSCQETQYTEVNIVATITIDVNAYLEAGLLDSDELEAKRIAEELIMNKISGCVSVEEIEITPNE